MPKIFVVNSRGEREPLSLRKIYRSARRAGASGFLAQRITKEIESFAYPGIKTSEIYQKIHQFLRKREPKSAIKYRLKEAIRKLGPTGFPFEKFIGEIFKELGYQVKLNQIVKGKCAKYEIDFIAEAERKIFVGECKFHHIAGERVDLKVALANYARFLDILNADYFSQRIKSEKEIKSILVTNTKLTSQAIKYSRCVGVDLIGWRYPSNQGLEKIITENQFYPITILPSCRGFVVDVLVQRKIMLVRDLLEIDISRIKGLSRPLKNKLEKLVREAELIISENR